jgi:hypothetical protein
MLRGHLCLDLVQILTEMFICLRALVNDRQGLSSNFKPTSELSTEEVPEDLSSKDFPVNCKVSKYLFGYSALACG